MTTHIFDGVDENVSKLMAGYIVTAATISVGLSTVMAAGVV